MYKYNGPQSEYRFGDLGRTFWQTEPSLEEMQRRVVTQLYNVKFRFPGDPGQLRTIKIWNVKPDRSIQGRFWVNACLLDRTEKDVGQIVFVIQPGDKAELHSVVDVSRNFLFKHSEGGRHPINHAQVSDPQNSAPERSVSSAEELMNEGTSLCQSGRLQQGINLFRKALVLNPRPGTKMILNHNIALGLSQMAGIVWGPGGNVIVTADNLSMIEEADQCWRRVCEIYEKEVKGQDEEHSFPSDTTLKEYSKTAMNWGFALVVKIEDFKRKPPCGVPQSPEAQDGIIQQTARNKADGKESLNKEIQSEDNASDFDKFNKYFIPLAATLVGFIFSIPFKLFGFIITGGATLILCSRHSKLLYDWLIEKNIDMLRLPAPMMRKAAIGITIFTMVLWLLRSMAP